MAHLATERALNTVMFKLFATMCFLVNGAVECTNYDDSMATVYADLASCEKDAEYRFYGMAEVFQAYNQPYEKILVGCKEADDDS